MDLYGFQQQLERLHSKLATAQKSAQELAGIRAEVDERIASLHGAVDADVQSTANERAQVGHRSYQAIDRLLLRRQNAHHTS